MSRGLAGHSMGGYGTTRIGMKRPDVFGALYIMSPCCLSVRDAPPADLLSRLHALGDPNEVGKLDFMGRATLAVAAAWSPNPARPPFFLDLPSADGSDPQGVLPRWAANAPLAMIDQYGFNLARYRAIAIDVGDEDDLRRDAAALHRRMEELGITASFEIYSGDHGNRVADRFQNHVLPFFGRNLSVDMGKATGPAASAAN
jgi:S-formylglutathione hydrolase FrmB